MSDTGKTEIIKVGVPAEGSSSPRPTRSGRKSARTANASGNPSTAAEEMENFKPVPVVGKWAWRTQYRLFVALLVVGVILLGWSVSSLTSASSASRDRMQAQVLAFHSLLDIDQSLSLARRDPSLAGTRLDTSLRNGSAAISRWSGSQPAWQDRWTKLEGAVKPFRASLATVSASDPRMISAADNARVAIAEISEALRATQLSTGSFTKASFLLLFSVAWVIIALAFLLWVHWKQQRLYALAAKSESERMQASIVGLMEHMRSISEGDLTRRAPVSADAVGTLADILNEAVERLRGLARSVKITSERTTAASQTATDATGLLVDRSREDLTSQVANGSDVLRLAQGVRRLAHLARGVNTTASETKLAVQSGSEAVSSARSRIESIRKLNEEAGTRVDRLALNSREIVNIVTLLNTLADEAGVLADQAALQASKAGDAGRGFKLVANGMAELALQTGESARKVGTLIETAVGDIEAARSAMSDAVSGTDEVSRLVDVSNDAGALAVDRANVLSESVGELDVLVTEHDRIANALDNNTKSALARIEDGQALSTKAAEGVMTLIEAVRELRASSDKFRV